MALTRQTLVLFIPGRLKCGPSLFLGYSVCLSQGDPAASGYSQNVCVPPPQPTPTAHSCPGTPPGELPHAQGPDKPLLCSGLGGSGGQPLTFPGVPDAQASSPQPPCPPRTQVLPALSLQCNPEGWGIRGTCLNYRETTGGPKVHRRQDTESSFSTNTTPACLIGSEDKKPRRVIQAPRAAKVNDHKQQKCVLSQL